MFHLHVRTVSGPPRHRTVWRSSASLVLLTTATSEEMRKKNASHYDFRSYSHGAVQLIFSPLPAHESSDVRRGYQRKEDLSIQSREAERLKDFIYLVDCCSACAGPFPLHCAEYASH